MRQSRWHSGEHSLPENSVGTLALQKPPSFTSLLPPVPPPHLLFFFSDRFLFAFHDFGFLEAISIPAFVSGICIWRFSFSVSGVKLDDTMFILSIPYTVMPCYYPSIDLILKQACSRCILIKRPLDPDIIFVEDQIQHLCRDISSLRTIYLQSMLLRKLYLHIRNNHPPSLKGCSTSISQC